MKTTFGCDNLNGKYSIFKIDQEKEKQTVCVIDEEQYSQLETVEGVWLHPEDIAGLPYVLNVCMIDDEIVIDEHCLPQDWKDKVTVNNGVDGKPSIYDLMN